MRPARIAAVAALLLAAVALAGVARPDAARSAEDAPAGITVTGTGTVTAVPDRATFWFGVQTEGRTASQALAANTSAMRRVVDALRDAGIAAADLQTQGVSVGTRMTETGETAGYTATNSVSARIRDLGRVGAVIDAAVAAGANQVNGPELTRSNAAELYRNALRRAYADARAKAQVLAETTGVSLGAVVNVVEAGGVPVPLGAGRQADAETTVLPGTQEIQASATVTFAVS